MNHEIDEYTMYMYEQTEEDRKVESNVESKVESTLDECKMIPQPSELKVDLYPHQLVSVHRMEKLEREQTFEDGNIITELCMGINADKTGSGKTIAMVTLIMRDKMRWNCDKLHVTEDVHTYSHGILRRRWLKKFPRLNTTLVLVNRSIVNQWCDELSKSPLKYTAVVAKKQLITPPAEYDVVIVTPNVYNTYVSMNANVAWKRFIFDEPAHLAVPGMKTVVAGFYWFVTATPDHILCLHRNRYTSFMKTVFGNISDLDYFLGAGGIIRNSDEFIRRSFTLPPTHHTYWQCVLPLYNTLHGLVDSKISNMIAAGNIEGAIKLLGGGETKNVVELVKNRKLKELKEIEFRIDYYDSLVPLSEADAKRRDGWAEKRVRVNRQISELSDRFDNILQKDCMVCFGKIQNPVLEPNCQNIFCGGCLMKWLTQSRGTCPCCRIYVKTGDLVYISIEEEKLGDEGGDEGGDKNLREDEKEEKEMTKEETIQSIIKRKPGGKFVVFSNYIESFSNIRRCLAEKKITYAEVKGSVNVRARVIEKFKRGNLQVLFLHTTFNGAGINLQEATDIIVYHDMCTDMLNQIMGRANRIGRKMPLNVHHLRIRDR